MSSVEHFLTRQKMSGCVFASLMLGSLSRWWDNRAFRILVQEIEQEAVRWALTKKR